MVKFNHYSNKGVLILLNFNFIQAEAPTELQSNDLVYGRLSGITRYIYDSFSTVDAAGNADYTIPGYITFFTIFILCVIVYKLGFAREIKLWQNVVIYTFLFLGCLLLTFFAFFLPMIEGLIVAALILIVYKGRMKFEKREEEKTAN